MDILEKRQEGHEAANKLTIADTADKFTALENKMVELRLEVMKVVTKVSIAGFILGAIGSFMLQKFAK
jgi:hypothetical protein